MSTLGEATGAAEAPPPVPGLRGKVVSGLAWKGASQLVNQGSRVVFGVVVARMLTPEEYGLAAMALAFAGLALIFADPALGAALIQRPTITEADRSTVFWTTVAAGVLCTLAGFALAGPIASFFSEPDVRALFVVESLGFVLIALSATQVALLTRELQFRSLELRDMAGTVAAAAAGIAAALAGLGAWAIIVHSLTSVAVGTLLLWRLSTWRPRLLFSFQSLRECGSFGGKLFVARLMSYVNINADNLLIGRVLGSAALGVYAIAYNTMFAPLARIASPIQQVLLPAFARLQHDRERLGRAWLRGSRLSAAVSLPAFAGMAVVAPDFVPVVLGERWSDAVPVLQLLCWAGFLQGVQMLELSVLQALGRAGTYLRYMTVSCAANLAAFAIGLQWGIVGVAAAFAIARSVVVPVLTVITCRAVGLSLSSLPRTLANVAVAGAVMAGAVVALRLGLREGGLGEAARLPLLVAAGAAVYCGWLWWRDRGLVAELKAIRSGDPSEP